MWTPTDRRRVFVVDDDDAVRESLGALLESHGFEISTYASAGAFLAAWDPGMSGCLLADVRMPDMNGLELQEKVMGACPGIAVVIMTGHGDVPIAVRAMKAGAVDFMEKPFDEAAILATVRAAMAEAELSQRQSVDAKEAASRLALLTDRERDVLEGLITGLPNKTIGYDLGISSRTVEVHRARVMDKMRARSLSQLIRMSMAAGIVPK
jgi:two-component system response regulator FixJ